MTPVSLQLIITSVFERAHFPFVQLQWMTDTATQIIQYRPRPEAAHRELFSNLPLIHLTRALYWAGLPVLHDTLLTESWEIRAVVSTNKTRNNFCLQHSTHLAGGKWFWVCHLVPQTNHTNTKDSGGIRSLTWATLCPRALCPVAACDQAYTCLNKANTVPLKCNFVKYWELHRRSEPEFKTLPVLKTVT